MIARAFARVRPRVRAMSTTAAPDNTCDVAIIGAGIIGSSTALELCRRGFRVKLVDTNTSIGYGSTSFSSGVCRCYYSIVDSVKFAWEGYNIWQNWEDHIAHKCDVYASLRETGGVLLRNSASEAFLAQSLPCLDEVGIPYEIWDSDLMREELVKGLGWDLTMYGARRIDDLDFGTPSGEAAATSAVFMPNTGYVSDPQLAVGNLVEAALATGRLQLELGPDSRVVSIEQRDGGVTGLRLAGGRTLSSAVVLNAAGPHSNQITAMAFPGRQCSGRVPCVRNQNDAVRRWHMPALARNISQRIVTLTATVLIVIFVVVCRCCCCALLYGAVRCCALLCAAVHC
jgi:sarcosine oxidase subunit beta